MFYEISKIFNFLFDLKIDFLIKKSTKTWKNLGGRGWGGGGGILPRIPRIYVEGRAA